MQTNKRFRKPEFDEEKPQKRKPVSVPTEQSLSKNSAGYGDLSLYIKDQQMIKQLKKNGISSLFPIQYETFQTIIKGSDIIAKDRTGSGKTLAYSLPALQKLRRQKILGNGNRPKMLIMLPTRQLAIQVNACFQSLKLDGEKWNTVALYGGDPINNQISNLKANPQILIATPGRLIDFINRSLIAFQELRMVVLDQADEMLKQGFQLDIQQIFRAVTRDTPKKPQVILFSATIPDWLQGISAQYQQKGCPVVDLIGTTTISIPKTIKHLLVTMRSSNDIAKIANLLCKKYLTASSSRCFIFCQTKREVNNLYSDISSKRCQMLHGDVKQSDRERIYRGFKAGDIQIIVATNVAARGLDFPEVELVIQTEPPRQVESYIHRAGRTGRAGRSGTSVVLVQKKDFGKIGRIESAGGFKFEELYEDSLERN